MRTQADPVMVGNTPVFAGPVKHSVTISGHQTSISLEPLFWAALRRAAQEDNVTISALIAQIDAERIAGFAGPTAVNLPAANLASAIRCWLWQRYCETTS